MVTSMPERREGQDIVNIYVNKDLKENFKRICQIKGATMTEELTEFMERTVREHQDVLAYIDERMGDGD